jgi:hypothetical protein
VHGAVAGERARLRLRLRDEWGNQIGRTRTAAPDAPTTAPQLLIELMSEEVLGGTTASPATAEVSKPRLQADGSYSMHYTVVRTGTCRVSVLLGTKHVRHSPSLVLVRAGAPVSLRLRAPSHFPICGEMYGPIAVWPVDAFGNAVLATPFEPLTLGAADGADKGADKGAADKGADKGTEPPVAPAEIVRLEWNYVSTRGDVGAHDGARADAHDGAQGGGGGGCGGTTHAMVATSEYERLHVAVLTLKLRARCGACTLLVCDNSPLLLQPGRLALTIAPGRLASLHAQCFVSQAVVLEPFGPLAISAHDAYGNALPAGDLPLRVSVRREGAREPGTAREPGAAREPGTHEALSTALRCEVWHRDAKATAAGSRFSAVLYLRLLEGEPGDLRACCWPLSA